jgi:uncharacterized protein YndB with AHSA1/START domain
LEILRLEAGTAASFKATRLLSAAPFNYLWAIVFEGGNQMARIEVSVEINRPIEQVFAYVTDIKNLSKWDSAILEVEQTSSGQIGIGTTFKGANKVIGRRMPWTSKVTDCGSNQKWSETISSGKTSIDLYWTFESIGRGTKFIEVYDMKIGGFLKLFAPMITSSTRKGLKKSLGNLKSILEPQT